jgi:molybdenum cofactor guanylyltransferase
MSKKTKPEKEPENGKPKLRSAIVLAGGKGKRMGMTEKALLEVKGKSILERQLESLFQVVDEVILSFRDIAQKERFRPVLEKFSSYEVHFCFDTLVDAGPLEGIRGCLLQSRSEYSFVCAGDMPFIDPRVVDFLFENAIGHNAALPKWGEGTFEPLHAVYSKKIITEIEKALENGKYSVLTPVLETPDVVFIEISEIRKIDPDLKTFANINTAEDLKSNFFAK